MRLPRATAHLVDFAHLLREHGFPAAHEQMVMFLSAVHLLGPKSIESVRQAAHATLAPSADRHAEFDALFHAFFFAEAAVISAARSLPRSTGSPRNSDSFSAGRRCGATTSPKKRRACGRRPIRILRANSG